MKIFSIVAVTVCLFLTTSNSTEAQPVAENNCLPFQYQSMSLGLYTEVVRRFDEAGTPAYKLTLSDASHDIAYSLVVTTVGQSPEVKTLLRDAMLDRVENGLSREDIRLFKTIIVPLLLEGTEVSNNVAPEIRTNHLVAQGSAI